MKKILFTLFFINITLCNYGQIVADHTVVDQYDQIPQYYIDKVKNMWLSVPGASHSLGYLIGLENLESIDSKFIVNKTASGTPEAYTNQYLRISQATWGNLVTPTGWLYGEYHEDDWFNGTGAETLNKNGIKYCYDNNVELSVYGFGWCYYSTDINIDEYVTVTQSYIDYCEANGYNTKVFFSTGPVDYLFGTGSTGWIAFQHYEQIRDSVSKDPSRILFDYADILCYDDGSDTPSTAIYDGNTYPVGTPTNTLPEGVGHIADPGKLRLAKAMWWMLARIAGWDGVTTDIENDKENLSDVFVVVTDNEIHLEFNNEYFSEVTLYSLYGKVLLKHIINSPICDLNTNGLSSGIYFVYLKGSNKNEIVKVVL